MDTLQHGIVSYLLFYVYWFSYFCYKQHKSPHKQLRHCTDYTNKMTFSYHVEYYHDPYDLRNYGHGISQLFWILGNLVI